MEVTKVRETTAQTAKRLRQHLKREFPGTKFSVRSSVYSGGSSIHVRWADGPSTQEVRGHTYEYEGASFNAMIDLKEYKDDVLYANEDGTYTVYDVGADYVLEQREVSQEWREEVAKEIERVTGETCDLHQWGDIVDGEKLKTNGDGWDKKFCALWFKDEGKLYESSERSQATGRDLFYGMTAGRRD